MDHTICALGSPRACGAYVLRIDLAQMRRIRFGRFQQAKPLALTAGAYIYIGSAMARRGASTLARRLLRHATRSGTRRPHPIRGDLAQHFYCRDLLPSPHALPADKNLHWNIHYLLEQRAAQLATVYVLYSAHHLESQLASFFAHIPHARIVAKGLGAGDAPGHTHLLRIEAPDAWWSNLPQQLQSACHLD